jgi:hypothetical protein
MLKIINSGIPLFIKRISLSSFLIIIGAKGERLLEYP